MQRGFRSGRYGLDGGNHSALQLLQEDFRDALGAHLLRKMHDGLDGEEQNPAPHLAG